MQAPPETLNTPIGFWYRSLGSQNIRVLRSLLGGSRSSATFRKDER